MVCNGHYSTPAYGEIANIAKYPGRILHSHDYRTPNLFKDVNVVVFGAAASGMDIGLEIASVAKNVYLSHNNSPLISKLPENLIQIKGLKSYNESSKQFELTDNSTLKLDQADIILFCTGYNYSFPFFNEDIILIDDEMRRVKPLYKHLININHPSMAFIGIPIKICPFPLFDFQVQYFVNYLKGQFYLPSRDKMLQDTENELKEKIKGGMAERHFHKLGDWQWKYNKELAQIAKIPFLNPSVEKLYNDIHIYRRKNLMIYKNQNYILTPESGGYYKRIDCNS